MQYDILLIPQSHPAVIRPCAKCGAMKRFRPASEIRINAQKKRLDVWLIHRCEDCGQTWNLEIFSRIAPDKLDRALYDRLLANDEDLVRSLAFDPGLHARRGAQLCHDDIVYRIEGQIPQLGALAEPAELRFHCEVTLGVKISKILREVLRVSARRLDALIASGALTSLDGLNLGKAKMGACFRVMLAPSLDMCDMM